MAATARAEAEFFVAADGNNSWSGQAAGPDGKGGGPLATLRAARDAIRSLRKGGKGPSGPVTVWIAQGEYFAGEGLDLTAADSGAAGAPVVYRAAKDANVRITGGKAVAGWSPVTDAAALARLPQEARDKVVQADLKAQGIADLGRYAARGFGRSAPAALELFWNDQPMPLTRWPVDDWAKISAIPEGAAEPDAHGGMLGKISAGFHYEGDAPKAWAPSDDIWAHGYWAWDWANSYEHVAVLDANRAYVLLGEPNKPAGQYGFRLGQRFYFLNILEELGRPGQWYLDRKSGMLYFWPPSPLASGRATVSLTAGPLVSMKDASHVTIEGLTLECARGDGVVIRGGAGNTVASCTLRNLGNYGVVVAGGQGHSVRDCEIHDLGDGGVNVSGGDRKTLEPSGHVVHNNRITRIGQWSRCYCPAVLANGVGITVSHNDMHDLPHTAVLFGGNEHVIEYNEIHHVCMETGDAGAIYAGRDVTMRGNVIRYNYIHHMGGVGMGTMGVYLDDCFSSATIFGNVFFKATRAAFIGGGRDNVVENNIFVDCEPAVCIDGRGLAPEAAWRGNVQTLVERLAAMNHHQPPYSTRYPKIAEVDKYFATADKFMPPEGNIVRRNVCSGGTWKQIHWHADPNLIEMSDNLVAADPGFVDRAKENFQLRDDSPAYKMGFQRIPLEKIGRVKP